MGFRSTFTSSDYSIEWPDWFREKYGKYVYIPEKGSICSKVECKVYLTWLDLVRDVQKAIDWDKFSKKNPTFDPQGNKQAFTLLFLHECEGVSRCQIYRDRIIWSEPEKIDGWYVTKGVTHSYCYGCSEPIRE